MFRTTYDLGSDDYALYCEDPSLAQQSAAEESDINFIVERFTRTGELPPLPSPDTYGDFTHVTDYHTALNSLIAADEAFMQLPAKLRAKFSNDVSGFLEFMADDKNRDEAIELGLIPKPPEGQIMDVRLVQEPDDISGGVTPPKKTSLFRRPSKGDSEGGNGGE